MIHVCHLLSLAITSSLPTCFAFFSVCKPSPTRQPHGWILADCCRSCHGLTLNFLNFSEPVASLLCQEAATIPNSLQLASLISACTKQACLRTRDLSRTVFFRDLQNGSLIYTTFIAPVHAVQVSGTVDAASPPFTNSTSCVINHRKKKKNGAMTNPNEDSEVQLHLDLGFLAIQKRPKRQRLDGGHRIMETSAMLPNLNHGSNLLKDQIPHHETESTTAVDIFTLPEDLEGTSRHLWSWCNHQWPLVIMLLIWCSMFFHLALLF